MGKINFCIRFPIHKSVVLLTSDILFSKWEFHITGPLFLNVICNNPTSKGRDLYICGKPTLSLNGFTFGEQSSFSPALPQTV